MSHSTTSQVSTADPAGRAASGSLGGWAGSVTRQAPEPPAADRADRPDRSDRADRAGRRTALALGAAMVGSPLAMTAWFLVEPSVLPREDPAVFLASVATSPDRYLIGTGLVLLSGALGIPAGIGFARLLRRRLPRLGAVVGLLMALSGIGLCVQVGFRAFVWSLVDAGSVPAGSVDAYARFQDGGLFDVLVAPGLVFGGLATLLTVGALLRTRQVGRWVPAAMVVGMVLASGELSDAVTIAGAALGAVANLAIVRALLAAPKR